MIMSNKCCRGDGEGRKDEGCGGGTRSKTSCMWRFVRDKVVCERWCVKDGGWQRWCVKNGGWRGGGGGGRGGGRGGGIQNQKQEAHTKMWVSSSKWSQWYPLPIQKNPWFHYMWWLNPDGDIAIDHVSGCWFCYPLIFLGITGLPAAPNSSPPNMSPQMVSGMWLFSWFSCGFTTL